MDYKIIRLADQPGIKEQEAQWFHEKWGVPLAAYLESMEESLTGEKPFPQWYVAVEDGRIIGGLGVIENDFHDRKDLAPNVCAVYTEENRRGMGVAGALLNYVCADMKERGIDTLYLLTDTTPFMSGTAGSFSAWRRGTGSRNCRGCMYTGRNGMTKWLSGEADTGGEESGR